MKSPDKPVEAVVTAEDLQALNPFPMDGGTFHPEHYLHEKTKLPLGLFYGAVDMVLGRQVYPDTKDNFKAWVILPTPGKIFHLGSRLVGRQVEPPRPQFSGRWLV